MAQAAFTVNHVRLIDKGDHLVIEGKKQCMHGHVIDHVLLTVPAELKPVLREFLEETEQQKPSTTADSSAVTNRLEKYFRSN
ncbi:MAG: hypothetical protein ACUVXJ_12270 [Phycisphaerae bacterium]